MKKLLINYEFLIPLIIIGVFGYWMAGKNGALAGVLGVTIGGWINKHR